MVKWIIIVPIIFLLIWIMNSLMDNQETEGPDGYTIHCIKGYEYIYIREYQRIALAPAFDDDGKVSKCTK